MALTSQSDVSVTWTGQARFIRQTLTDSIIDEAFSRLPKGIEDKEIKRITRIIKERREKLEVIAKKLFCFVATNSGADGNQPFRPFRDRPP